MSAGGASSSTFDEDSVTLEDQYRCFLPPHKYVNFEFDPKRKTLTLPFHKFDRCLNHKAGLVHMSMVGNGTLKSLVSRLESEFKMKFENPNSFNSVKNELIREPKKVHLTVMSNQNDDALNIQVHACYNCTKKRELVIVDVNKKNKDISTNDLMILVGVPKDTLHILKVKNVEIVCDKCYKVYSASGHKCRKVFKKIFMPSHKSIFKKLLCVDIFYDIETYWINDRNLFHAGLVAFTYNVRVSNPMNEPRDMIFGQLTSMIAIANMEIDQILTERRLEKVLVALPNKYCYYIMDKELEEKDDIMLSFLDVLEQITKYFVYCNKFPLNTRVSLISFNGNKFDDFFLFKSLCKKGGLSNTPLQNFRILERGSKLLCIAADCERPPELLFEEGDEVEMVPLGDEGQLVPRRRTKKKKRSNEPPLPRVSFRTQDLRNFISTGSLDSNARLYEIPCMKTVFPHLLINHLARNRELDRVLESFPSFEFYKDVIKIDFCEHGLRGGCLPCKQIVYEELKQEHGENPFDTLKIWYTYCCNDVYVTENLYYKFFLTLSNLYTPLFGGKQIDPTAKLTLPSLTNTFAYLAAELKFGKDILCTPMCDSLDHCYKAIYGGHCQTSVIGILPNPEDYIFFDFNGEYAGLMECPLPCGEIECIEEGFGEQLEGAVSRMWCHENKDAHFQDLPPFIVSCSLEAPTDKRLIFDLPNVPERSEEDNFLRWSFESKRGVYSSVDIFVAVHFYRFKFKYIHNPNNIRFEKYEYLLRDYIRYCQSLKREGKIEKNKCKENVGKLMGNALYGYQIKKQDKDKMEYVSCEPRFSQLKSDEYKNIIKINHVIPVSEIIDKTKNPKLSLQTRSIPSFCTGMDFPFYESMSDSDSGDENYCPSEYPLFVKYSLTSAFMPDSNTMPQIGIFVLSFSRLLNSQIYFEDFIKPCELSIPIDEREPVVVYTDTDSFLIKKQRMSDAKWVGSPNVTYNPLNRKFEPWGKNELDFTPSKILIAGRKLYCCCGPDGQMKTAAKGVDRNELTVEKFQQLIDKEVVGFDQPTFKKNFTTYDIESTTIHRELALSTMYMKPIIIDTANKYIQYRPFTDYDDPEEKSRAKMQLPDFNAPLSTTSVSTTMNPDNGDRIMQLYQAYLDAGDDSNI